ncbi:ornithine monooxygenase [Variovorax paradoxus]|jgi:L-ornithine N5-oxygenase|uniref:lysine N(6)-hydroxylase/L-ornithine N(5)-oxygenase family protein n=1 Tax=Variovorax TaxID=34072 RepID=UPI0006E6149B|nr:lysine N(6)-hydroxylase/L-ornithine N(5)-oxygenase family protein [Variovorax sp. CY25R-8]KPU91772.1 ornithine monooxygenase [Variovorax paradoxus]KPU94105.1 ornithine monooxygenase [Variovorax paradoxus]KPV01026.1 ornithine monooxygenase [Variovorax paradoxus]KPV20592.1 ornithine monooxygenase [Variovorax paradoxus]KPV22210.1 ornithine monooxygenase [Variovorax paradoxus]
MQHIHDLIGVGFGPSNIALAIALEEKRHGGRPADALFIERQPSFAWHPHMLLEQAHMQISFLKDLATLRNPTSRFTFINYLHESGRLPDFINLKSFFPSRHEFNDYLGWAARQFDDACAYGEEVFEVLPEKQGAEVPLLRVRSRREGGGVQERLARNLVVSIGGTPRIPECFRPLRGDGRVLHSSGYLRDIAKVLDGGAGRRIAIVGAGQSAAEIFMDLQGRPGAPRVDFVMRARSIRPSDDSPFVNEVFNVDFTDYVYSRPSEERAALLEEVAQTNYAVADLDLIQQIYKVFYDQKVARGERLRMLRQHEVRAARASADGIHLQLRDQDAGVESTVRYDAVVLATGYEREQHKGLLQPLAPYLGDFSVDRHYRLEATPDFQPGIFLQGACEDSHGISDTLLSVTSVRTGEIGNALLAALPRMRSAAREDVRVAQL